MSTMLDVRGDTIVVYDRSRRTIFLDGSLALLASSHVPGPVHGVMSGGRLLTSVRQPRGRGGDDPRDSSLYISCTVGQTACDRADTLGMFVNSDPELSVTVESGGAVYVVGVSNPKPFGRVASTVACGSGFVHASGGAWRLGVYSADGRLQREIVSGERGKPVTRSRMDAWTSAFLSTAPERQRAGIKRGLEGYRPPPIAPAIGRILCDDADRIWVEEFPDPESPTRYWTILNLEGRPLGRLSIPVGEQVLSVGADYVVLQTTDRDGVPSVSVYGISHEQNAGGVSNRGPDRSKRM
jgi:hypothetical protein